MRRWLSLAVGLAMTVGVVPAGADSYGKDLLLLKKALRDNNCAQAYEAASRMTSEQPARPDAFAHLGDAQACLDKLFEAYQSYRQYEHLGGDEDVSVRLAGILGRLPRVDFTISAVEVPAARPFMTRAEYTKQPVRPLPSDLTCELEGVTEDQLAELVTTDDDGCVVRVPPGELVTVHVRASGFEQQSLQVHPVSLGQTVTASVEIARTLGATSLTEGSWVLSTLEDYPAVFLVRSGDEHPVGREPVWVPAGLHEVAVYTDQGVKIAVDKVEIPQGQSAPIDLTGFQRERLQSLHGEVGLRFGDVEYRAELTSKVPVNEGETISLSPGERAHVLAGVHRVVIYRLGSSTGEGEAEYVASDDDVELVVRAGTVASLLEQGDMRRGVEKTWFASVAVTNIPVGARAFLGTQEVGPVGVDQVNDLSFLLRPGRYDLSVVAPWRNPWRAPLDLGPKQSAGLVYDAGLLTSRDKAMKMRKLATASFIAGGVTTVVAAVLAGAASSRQQAAQAADEDYMSFDGGIDDEGAYLDLDSARREHARDAMQLQNASGLLFGVSGAVLGFGVVLEIGAPRDPNRPVLSGIRPFEVQP